MHAIVSVKLSNYHMIVRLGSAWSGTLPRDVNMSAIYEWRVTTSKAPNQALSMKYRPINTWITSSVIIDVFPPLFIVAGWLPCAVAMLVFVSMLAWDSPVFSQSMLLLFSVLIVDNIYQKCL